MNFREMIDSVVASARVQDVQAAIRAAEGRGATRWVAAQAGISQRTARRWLSNNPPRSRVTALIGLIDTTSIAAYRIRGAESISIGTVAVAYDDQDEGSRNIGDLDVDSDMANALAHAAEALESGDWAAAEDWFSDAVIMGYSPGLEETLDIADYFSGVHLR